MLQVRDLGPLLFILYPSYLFHIARNLVAGYADDTTIYAVIPRPLSRSQVMVLLNQDYAAINSLCLKWHVRLNPKKMKSMVLSRSRSNAPGYGDLTLGGAELEDVKCLRIFGVILDTKLTLTFICGKLCQRLTRI